MRIAFLPFIEVVRIDGERTWFILFHSGILSCRDEGCVGISANHANPPWKTVGKVCGVGATKRYEFMLFDPPGAEYEGYFCVPKQPGK